MSNIVNLTPHTINIVRGDAIAVDLPPSDTTARVAVTREYVGLIHIQGVPVPVNVINFGEVVGLPAPVEDTYYVVSTLVAQAAKDRFDLLTVDELVRDERGCVIGAKAFAHFYV